MHRSRAHLWFIGPALMLMVLILILPILIAFGLSLTDYSLGNSGAQFVGIDNYEKIFTRRNYAKMFGATFRYVLVVVPLTVGLGLVVRIYRFVPLDFLLMDKIILTFEIVRLGISTPQRGTQMSGFIH